MGTNEIAMTATTTPPNGMARLEAALAYAQRGWRVIPLHGVVGGACTCDRSDCSRSGKHPLTPNGLKNGSIDEATIRRWWQEEAPLANVGVVTGRASGLWVLGPDGQQGIEALTELERIHGPLPATPRSRTGGGGRHYAFAYPPRGTINNAVNLHGLKIDVRGEGGFIVAPPSAHLSGGCYAWELGPDIGPLASAPDWLLSLVRQRSAVKERKGKSAGKEGGLVLRVLADDLRTAPGVAEGGRHDAALRLVGAHLGRGDGPDDVEALALAWAERCNPPLPAAEVVRIVRDLAGKGGIMSSANVDTDNVRGASYSDSTTLELLPLPEPPPWPNLEPAALHGLAGEIVRTIEPHTEADPVGLLAQLVCMIGNLVGPGPHFQIEGDRHPGNLFVVLVGKSGQGRKGVGRGRALQLARMVDPEWVSDCIHQGLSSGEGLIWAVRDPVEKMEPVKEKGKVVRYEKVEADPGVTDKRAQIVETEFAQVLRVLRRESNTLSPVIRAAWDGGDLRTMVKHNPARATGAHISIIGHVTETELTRYLNETELFNGFANRFLWLKVRRARWLPDGGGALDLTPLAQRLSAALQFARNVGGMTRSPAAAQLWRTVYSQLSRERPGLFGAVTSRAEAQVLRLSMVYALLDSAPVIDVPHLNAALALWAYCEQSARLIFGAEDAESDNPLEGRILKLIRAASGGMTRSDVHGALSGHIPAQELLKALAGLRDKRLIVATQQSTGGRPAERWFARSAGETSEESEESPAAGQSAELNAHISHLSPAAPGTEVMEL
jgi:hypothetical protein